MGTIAVILIVSSFVIFTAMLGYIFFRDIESKKEIESIRKSICELGREANEYLRALDEITKLRKEEKRKKFYGEEQDDE